MTFFIPFLMKHRLVTMTGWSDDGLWWYKAKNGEHVHQYLALERIEPTEADYDLGPVHRLCIWKWSFAWGWLAVD